MQHLCSRTLKPSHTESFVESWTSFPEDSRASHSQLLESVKLLKTPDTSSPTSQTESENANLEFAFSKTYKESSPAKQPTESQFSNMSSESWKDWVTEQRQEYSQRKKSAHLIRESESLSWGTPNSRDWKDSMNTVPPSIGKTRGLSLGQGVAAELQKNWPTATARDWKGCGNAINRKDGKHRIDNLEAVIKYGHPDQANPNTNGKSRESWPTPRETMSRDATYDRGKGNFGEVARGKLNPDWVEHLMGLPAGWTDLGSWETE
jgi:hypothetical protein